MSSLHAYDWTTGFGHLQRRFACLDAEFTPAALAGKPVRRRLCLSCQALSDECWTGIQQTMLSYHETMLQAYIPHPLLPWQDHATAMLARPPKPPIRRLTSWCLQDHELLRLLATLLRGPNFTLAVTSCFQGVALQIVALAIATSSSRSAARTAEPQQWRVRAALEAVALIRLLDITLQALR